MHTVAATVAGFVAEHGLDGPMVVGVSGGPDSTALLHALHAAGSAPHVAHLHHGLRGAAADGDAEFVAQLAAELDLSSTVERADLADRSEDAARRARRAFLEAVADAAGARWIALGHTADDQAETVLHHVLRGAAADGDAEFVAQLAAELDLSSTVERADLADRSEDAARRARRAFLEAVADAAGARWIALGHTADDQAETVLHHVLRGTGLPGLAGMRPVAGRFVRPLLGLRRGAVLDYLEALGAAYRHDETNLDPAFTRNRIRHDLLPRLAAEYNPHVVEALTRLAELAGEADEWIVAEVAALDRAAVRRAGGMVHVDATATAAAPRFLRLALLRELIAEAAGGAAAVTFGHAAAAEQLLEAPGPAVALPGGVAGRRSGDVVTLAPEAAGQPSRWEVDVALPGTTSVDAAGVRVELALVPPPADPATPPGEAYLDADQVQPPLTVRNRRPGDRFHPLGAPGGQKLKQFLSDRKVPVATRDRVPLLVDRAGIVCVLGHRIADRVRVTPATARCVHVAVRPV